MSSMTRFLTIPRSPAKAAAGSGALILAALVGVLLAAGNAGGASPASAPTTSAPFNAAPLVLPKPCVLSKRHQTCGAVAPKQRRAKQVKKQPAPSSTLPVSTALPTPTGP
jgi:hypothetical protein